ncbi:MAG: alpha-glucosidase, partial [Acetanaerobacterium sp.]
GVDVLWLSPVYDSPCDDNGYDIRDYRRIMREFGTMKDFDHLLAETHKRGMRLIMDLVINHTSDEHAWFKDACENPRSPYRDYYIWRTSPDKDTPPNNWTSLFGGSAWSYYPEAGAWALHLFSKKQMDLNWDNPALREELYDMINWWLGKGIDGFRMDVISFISKNPALPDGSPLLEKLAGFCGVEHYFHGPRLHEYLQELQWNTFSNFNAMTVGETPIMGMEMAKLLTDERRGELDTIFNFDHLENPGRRRFDDYRYDLNVLKELWSNWQLNYGNACWQTLFYENHDNPRMISKINPDPQHREAIAKLLAMVQFTLRGTPFVYQGQELGMVNTRFASINEVSDVESLNLYSELLDKGRTPAEALAVINAGTRDHARTPMQWDKTAHGGFTTGTPWIVENANYTQINAKAQEQDNTSPLAFFKKAIALRKKNPALIYGRFLPVRTQRDLFCYYRELEGVRFYIEINLADHAQKRHGKANGLIPLLASCGAPADILRPYEAVVYRCK